MPEKKRSKGANLETTPDFSNNYDENTEPQVILRATKLSANFSFSRGYTVVEKAGKELKTQHYCNIKKKEGKINPI